MILLVTLRMALSSLGANKLRAGLTLLGIVIGVSAVISLMAIGRGRPAVHHLPHRNLDAWVEGSPLIDLE